MKSDVVEMEFERRIQNQSVSTMSGIVTAGKIDVTKKRHYNVQFFYTFLSPHTARIFFRLATAAAMVIS